MKKDVLIIGGGIIGLCSAYYLHQEGHQVTVIDKSSMDDGASYVNAGYLTPSHIIPLAAPGMISKGLRYMFDSSSPFYLKPRWDFDFFKWAWYFKKSSTKSKVDKAIPVIKNINVLSRELYEDIKATGRLKNFHLENKGLLMLYQTEKAGHEELQVSERAQLLGIDLCHYDRQQIQKFEQNIDLNVLGGFHYKSDRHSTPNEFMKAMREYLATVGVKIFHNEEVTELNLSKGSIDKVMTTKNGYQVDEVVLAAGSWSSHLAQKLGLKLSLQAGKGYCIDVDAETNITMPALLLEAKVAVTPMNGFTRFAGTMEFSGINHNIRKERVDAIALGASKFYDGIKITDSSKAKAKCGLRPVSPDGLPYIGKSSQIKNLTIATGHAMMGWSLGPATGKLVSELISDRKPSFDILPFYPERKF